MSTKKASIIKRSALPGMTVFPSLKKALDAIRKVSSEIHEQAAAKVLKKAGR